MCGGCGGGSRGGCLCIAACGVWSVGSVEALTMMGAAVWVVIFRVMVVPHCNIPAIFITYVAVALLLHFPRARMGSKY